MTVVNKSLPPLPIDHEEDDDNDSAEAIFVESMLPSLFPQQPIEYTPAYALAQAALGLPHVLPSSASPATSTVPFATPVSPARSPVRRTKSSRKLTEAPAPDSQPERKRRTRGLSLGASSFLNFSSPDPKGKAKEQTPNVETKVISRRSSFWSRKRPVSSAAPEVPDSSRSSSDLYAPLTLVLPTTPLIPDSVVTGSPSTHSRGLSRSHSERTSSSHAAHVSIDSNLELQPKTRRKLRRPATADSSGHSKDLASPTNTPLPSSSSHPPALERPPFSEALVSRPTQRISLSLLSSASRSSGNFRDDSPAPSLSSDSSRPSLQKVSIEVPKPLPEEESPTSYVQRLSEAVGRADIAAVLASSADPFHTQALRAYISQFDFTDDPLDIALRRLLMAVGLPRETQQIDRVMEAFAARYMHCNPGIFLSEDHPYILAFSLIMLHTDAFNKSNKRKMSKADYIKNTHFPGSLPEVLDCFYDNIVFAPFIFVEDPLEKGAGSDLRLLSSAQSSVNGSSSFLGKSNKIDPYYLISNNLLGPLRVNIETHLAPSNSYSWEGTTGPWEEQTLRRAFADGRIIEVLTEDQARPSSAFFNLNAATGPPSPLLGSLGAFPDLPRHDTLKVKIIKAGTLNRKDDTLQGGRKASARKWRSWSVLLTASQLLFFRDPSWAASILAQSESSDGSQFMILKPDEVFSVKDTIAVYDVSYTKHRHALRLIIPDGRRFLLQAHSDQELDEWISRINYASAFKTAGASIRPMGMSGKDIQLTGVAAATSHLHDLQAMKQPAPRLRHWGSESSRDLLSMLSPDSDVSFNTSPVRQSTEMVNDAEVPTAPEIEGADQFKATFDQVKWDLAAGRRPSSSEEQWKDSSESDSTPPSPLSSANGMLPSRTHLIQSEIRNIESRMVSLQSELDSDMRLVRNIAILTPFQRSTRDRLQASVQVVAKKVDQLRLEIVKLRCYRDILTNDLASAGRDWRLNKNLALRAATQMIDSQRALEQRSSSSPGCRRRSSHRPESTCESFYSALDFDWPSSEDIVSPSVTPSRSHSMFNLSSSDSPIPTEELRSHEKFYTAHENLEEQAEPWNKTRCAQRVSLIRVPSDFIGLSNRFDKRTEDHFA